MKTTQNLFFNESNVSQKDKEVKLMAQKKALQIKLEFALRSIEIFKHQLELNELLIQKNSVIDVA